MRFGCTLYLEDDPAGWKLPVNYRLPLMSLIKEALQSRNNDPSIFLDYYGDKTRNRQKPFTFSVHLPVERQEEDCFILNNNRIRLYFSSCDSFFLMSLYNGLVGLRRDFSPFSGQKIRIRSFFLQKEEKIHKEEINFKTFSPVLVRDIDGTRGQGFLRHDDEKFTENLFHSILNLCRNFIREDYELAREDVDILLVKCKSDIVRHYGGEIGGSGSLKIRAPQEVLQLIYDAGLGAKRSQGFGMLEVIKTSEEME